MVSNLHSARCSNAIVDEAGKVDEANKTSLIQNQRRCCRHHAVQQHLHHHHHKYPVTPPSFAFGSGCHLLSGYSPTSHDEPLRHHSMAISSTILTLDICNGLLAARMPHRPAQRSRTTSRHAEAWPIMNDQSWRGLIFSHRHRLSGPHDVVMTADITDS